MDRIPPVIDQLYDLSKKAGLASLELAAFCVTSRRSNQLIYSPKIVGIRNLLLGKELPVYLFKDSNLPPNGHEVSATILLFYSA